MPYLDFACVHMTGVIIVFECLAYCLSIIQSFDILYMYVTS